MQRDSGIGVQAEALRRADRVLVGGTLAAFRLPDEVALVVARGQGSHIWDVEGQEYVDFVLGSGPMILGHAHPSVVKAVREQIELGTQFYVVNEKAIQLAEAIVEAVPCAEKLRFTSSGSEAAFYALRLARAFTGRDKILKFEGAYHGHQDHTMMSVTPSSLPDFPTPVLDTAGVPQSMAGETLVAPFNDTETTLALMEKHARDLAAVIVEPFQRVLAPKPGFLEALRQATRDLGIVLVFDEVVTGFRLAYGGAQQFYGVTPDLASLGKIIGGGYPMAAVAGRADIMELCNSRNKGSSSYVYFSGTLNGNPVGAAAGIATLAELRKPGAYERLREVGERVRAGLAAAAAEEHIPAQVVGEGPLARLMFIDRPVESYRDLLAADRKIGVRLGTQLLKRGFFVNPGEKNYLSLVHTNEDIDSYVGATAEILHDIKKSG